MGYGLGVDLGTTFTAAARRGASGTCVVALGRGGEVCEPSVIYAAPDGSVLTGDAAEEAGAAEPHRLARGFKRRLGDPTPLVVGATPFSPAALLAAQLRSIVSRVERTEGAAPGSVVLTCPAIWGPYRREHFDEVPKLAGLTDTVIVTEPEAAAIHYAAERRLGVGELVAVYDLGGGTFDTTILRAGPGGMEIVGTPDGIERLGGMDFDEALFAHIDEAVGGALGALELADPAEAAVLAAVRRDCVRAKEELSAQPEVTLRLALLTGECEIVVTRRAFNGMIRPTLELTTEALRRTLTSAGLVPDDLAAVLLTGGSSRIPLVSEVVSEAFGRPVWVSLHPKHAVALGASAIAADRLSEPAAAAPAVRKDTTPGRNRSSRPGLVVAAVVTAVVVGVAAVAIALSPGFGTDTYGCSTGRPKATDNGTIPRAAPGSVTYQWARDDISTSAPFSFNATTTPTPVNPDGFGSSADSGTDTLNILSPVQVSSTASFTLVCSRPGRLNGAPTPSPSPSTTAPSAARPAGPNASAATSPSTTAPSATRPAGPNASAATGCPSSTASSEVNPAHVGCIQNVYTGWCLAANGADVSTEPCNNGRDQDWSFGDGGNGSIVMFHHFAPGCLDAHELAAGEHATGVYMHSAAPGSVFSCPTWHREKRGAAVVLRNSRTGLILVGDYGNVYVTDTGLGIPTDEWNVSW